MNEDSVIIRLFPYGLTAVLADGVGGQEGGQTASQIAVQTFAHFLDELPDKRMNHLESAAFQANQAVLSMQKKNCHMMSTLAGLVIENGYAGWVHVGDTRLYYFYNRRLLRRTFDHSVSQMAVLLGMIREDQIRFHEDRNRLLRALGSDSLEADVSEAIPLSEGFHAFLLCSDGFWEYVLEEEMEKTLLHADAPELWIAEMEKIVKQRMKADADNYTAAAVFAAGGM